MIPDHPLFNSGASASLASRSAHHAPALIAGMFALLLCACSKAPESVPTPSTQKQHDVASKASEVITAESPLAKAATRGNIAEVKELLDKGANPNVFDALGRTPLHMAVFYNHPKTTALLIARGADVNAKDRIGMTPLHAAVLVGSTQEVDLLLANKAEIDAVANSGLTPLHLAAATGRPQLVKLLIQRGANPLSKDVTGATPLFFAVRNKDQNSISLLQQYAGKE